MVLFLKHKRVFVGDSHFPGGADCTFWGRHMVLEGVRAQSGEQGPDPYSEPGRQLAATSRAREGWLGCEQTPGCRHAGVVGVGLWGRLTRAGRGGRW